MTRKVLRSRARLILLPLILLFAAAVPARASHIFGADFFYTFVSSTSTTSTYKITLVVYGDCSGSSFPALQGATPQVQVFKNTTSLQTTINLSQVGSGVEVSPVCGSQLPFTTCKGGTITGVTQYTYSANVVLSGTSSNWRFRFTGTMGSSASAGRSNSITNINTSSSGSVTVLEATLNNAAGISTGANSSPTYTTTPTPFFCVNTPQGYNPGAIDPNSDSLVFSLVSGLEPGASSGTNVNVTYLTFNGYSATSPLSVTGSIAFSSATGQLDFTPDAAQKSLVVNQVTEYRNGIAIGTSMREMTFVVLNTCNNNPPAGTISNAGSTVTVVDTTKVKACASGSTVTFSINPSDPNGDTIDVTYAGLPAGSTFTITGNGTPSPIGSFSWNISSVAAGTYTFFATFTDRGCPLSSKRTTAYSIVISPIPTISFALTSAATCTKKAVFTITPNTGGPRTLTISQGTTTIHTFSGVTGVKTDSLAIGTYTARTTDTNGCTSTISFTLAAPPVPAGTVSTVAPVCNGGSDGSITVTGTIGPAPFQYALGTGVYGTSGVFTGLTTGSYTIHIKDNNDCIKDTVVSVGSNPPPAGSVSTVGPVCNGGPDGSLTITGTVGTAPFQYAVGSGAYSTSGTFTGFPSGPQTVHIKDANSCTRDTVVTIPVTPPIIPQFNFSKPPCNAFASGTISVSASQGTAPYRYAIGSGPFGSSGVFTGLSSGYYTIHILDTNSCTRDTVVLLPDSIRVRANIAVTNILCNGASTGSVTLTAFGATAPYRYSSGSGGFGAINTFSGLPAGATTFHVKDTNNCFLDTVVTLTEPTLITATLTPTAALCFGNANGIVAVAASGGVSPYTYSINGGTYTGTIPFTGLLAGGYTVTVKDANACTQSFTTTVTQPTALGIDSVTFIRPSCNGLSDGSYTIKDTGGTAPYQYAIGAGAFGSSGTFAGLAAGTYTLHTKDANGCTKDTTITLGEPTPVTVTAQVRNSRCSALGDGQVMLTGGGGVPGYKYAVGFGGYSTNNVFTPLPQGTYNFHIRDTFNCQKDTTISIVDTIFVHATVTVVDAKCFDSLSGKITVVGNSAQSPYTYVLNGNSPITSGVFNGIHAGSQGIRITDANGCFLDTVALVGQPNRIVPSVTLTRPLCFGGSNGSLQISVTGGTPAFSYALLPGGYGGTTLFTGLTAGPYTFRVKDANSCITDTSVVLGQPTQLRLDSVKITNVLCFGGSSGTVTVYGHGGTRPYSYGYNSNAFQTDSLLQNMFAGTPVIHLKDVNGCQQDLQVTITQPSKLYFASAPVVMPTCEGFKDGVVNVRGKGGTPPYQYSPDKVTYDRQGGYPNLMEGTYSFRVKDSLGCTHDTTITLTGYPHIVVSEPDITPVRCWGERSGKIVLNVTGGFDSLYYLRTLPLPGGRKTINPVFDSLRAGTYHFVITDLKGCRKDTTYVLNQPDSLSINPKVIPNDCIGLDNAGALSTAVTGGNPPYRYVWGWNGGGSDGQTSVGNLPNGVYPLAVVDTKGCADTVTLRVGYDNCCQPFIPTAFTPNNDGTNDTWRALYKGDMTLVTCSIYNRFGQRVFVSANVNDQWDGTYENRPAEMGTYFYYIKVICGNKGDNIVEFQGDITLIR